VRFRYDDLSKGRNPLKDTLSRLVRDAPTPGQGRNLVREYLQARILGSLQRAGAMLPLAFHSGAALRFLYVHSRYSEDLDFSLERHPERYDLHAYLQAACSTLSLEGYRIESKLDDREAMQRAFVYFPGLLEELGLHPNTGEVLTVKIEVDTDPPAGAVLAHTTVQRFVELQLQHHDRASLLAGKLHSFLQRPYFKGRDLYDLSWYLSDPGWPPPNLALLNNALRQTGWQGGFLTEASWRETVWERVQDAPWEQAIDDVRPFLVPGEDASRLKLEFFEGLLRADRYN
jgi:hypothetical protein